MDDQSLRNVLVIYRKIVELNAPNFTPCTAHQFIMHLADGYDPRRTRDAQELLLGASAVARIAAYIIDQCQAAKNVIENSALDEEAKSGVIVGLNDLARAFSIENLNGQINVVHQAPGYISNLVILLSAAGIPTRAEIPKEAIDLAQEIDEFTKSFNDPQLDPVVREIALKHMAVLSTLIRHIPVFGLEAAITAYFELMMKLRRADSKSSEASKGALDRVIDTVKGWGERMEKVDKAMNAGANLLSRAEGLTPLLSYLPIS